MITCFLQNFNDLKEAQLFHIAKIKISHYEVNLEWCNWVRAR